MDRLRAESDLYTNARPIGFYTDLVLPGMLLGEELSWFRFTLPNNIAYVYTRDKQYHPWDPGQTVLGDAERANFNVGLVGWWNPYCTMFSGMLQQCFWSSSTPYNPMRPWYGVGKNMLVPYTERLITSSAPPLLGVHANDTLTLLDHAKADLANDQLDFVMVHLGTPHHPYVFDRHTGKLSIRPGHSYQDGLAMADWALGQMLDVIQSDPRWSRTTVIVQGDHSWRTAIWTTEPGWTGEDEKTSNHETFDDRPALLVHSPGQTTPGTIAAPTSLLQVHTMLESAIHTGAPTTAH
jgi:hypothetical protein